MLWKDVCLVPEFCLETVLGLAPEFDLAVCRQTGQPRVILLMDWGNKNVVRNPFDISGLGKQE